MTENRKQKFSYALSYFGKKQKQKQFVCCTIQKKLNIKLRLINNLP